MVPIVIFLFLFKLALFSLFLKAKFKRVFYLKQGNEDYFQYKLKSIKMAAVLEGVCGVGFHR